MDETKNDAQAQARARAARTERQFDAVFGQPGRRTAAQSGVLEFLEEFTGGGEEANAFQFRTGLDGISQIAAGIHVDGARSVMRVIHRKILKAAAQKDETPKPAVKVKR